MADEVQSSGTVLMVRPAAFAFHPEAAQSNAFASRGAGADASAALREFETLAEALDRAGVDVLVLDDLPEPAKPDAIFPNNWVSFHGDGTMVLYPMATAARRLERRADALEALLARAGFAVERMVDLSSREQRGEFLEGTGSLILDRPRRRAFASVSARTHPGAAAAFDHAMGYSTLLFDAHDRSGRAIYHTNVLLSLGTRFAILCSAAVDPAQLAGLRGQIEAGGRSIIDVDFEQMRQFACNLLELSGTSGPVIALSATARRSLRPEQLRSLEQFGTLAEADIPTIERVGGGSVRCMLADVHLPRISRAP